MDDATRIIMNLGSGSLLVKINIAHAFYNVPVHPADHHVLGMQWEGQVCIDRGKNI